MDNIDTLEFALFFHNEELSYKGYKRVSVPCTAMHWELKNDGNFTNKERIKFPETCDFIVGRRATHLAVYRGDARVAFEPLSRELAMDVDGLTPEFSPGSLNLAEIIVRGHKAYLNASFADLRLVDESDRAFLACGTHLIYGPLTSEQQHAFVTLSSLKVLP